VFLCDGAVSSQKAECRSRRATVERGLLYNIRYMVVLNNIEARNKEDPQQMRSFSVFWLCWRPCRQPLRVWCHVTSCHTSYVSDGPHGHAEIPCKECVALLVLSFLQGITHDYH
jgi:hypothetical protein